MTTSYFIRYLLLIAFFVVVYKSFKNTPRSYQTGPVTPKKAIPYVINLLVAGLFSWELFSAAAGSFCPERAVHLEFPLRGGEFCVVHGGATQILNHHFAVPSQQYGLDILQLNQLGSRTHRFHPESTADYNIFGATVYSPCDGTILEVINQHIDQAPSIMDQAHPAGNYIAIAKNQSDAVIVLAHLMQDSLLVEKGDIVVAGQALARVGNSGNTSEPHLHIHAMLNHTGDFLFKGKGIPMKFNDRFLTRNDRVISSEKTVANLEGLKDIGF